MQFPKALLPILLVAIAADAQEFRPFLPQASGPDWTWSAAPGNPAIPGYPVMPGNPPMPTYQAMPGHPATPDHPPMAGNPPTGQTTPKKTAGGDKQAAEAAKKLEEVGKRITVLTATTDVKVVIGGQITADFLYNEARPVAPGTPFFLFPGSPLGFEQDTFDAHARQTALFALVSGPEVCGWETGGLIMTTLYNDNVIIDRYGLLPIQAFGQIKNDEWRYAAGLQLDIFNPLNPTVLPFSLLLASGNAGAYRGQARCEHYIYPSPESQITLIGGISEPITTIISDEFQISEDNGWPNLEGRAALALGPLVGEGLEARRPFEIGASGVVGQIRTTLGALREVADVWGLGVDLRYEITGRYGFKAECYAGQTLGTYGGAILQNINTTTFQGLESEGWWAEVFWYWVPHCLHTHVGYGWDDVRDEDLAPGQLSQNETLFANLIWDINEHLRFAWELTYRKTDWVLLPDNDGFGAHYQARWTF